MVQILNHFARNWVEIRSLLRIDTVSWEHFVNFLLRIGWDAFWGIGIACRVANVNSSVKKWLDFKDTFVCKFEEN